MSLQTVHIWLHSLPWGGVCASHYLYLTVCAPYTVPPLALDLSWPQQAFVRPWFNPMAMLSLSQQGRPRGQACTSSRKETCSHLGGTMRRPCLLSGTRVELSSSCALHMLRLLLTPFCVVVSHLPTHFFFYSSY